MNLQVIRGNQNYINDYSFLLSVFVKIHMLGASSNNYVGALKSTSCMPKLKTWKAKVAGTFCSHIGTVLQVGAASYFACRSAAYENRVRTRF